MFKRFLIILTIISCCLCVGSKSAYADKEKIQRILKKVDYYERIAINYFEKYQKIKRNVQKGYTGLKKAKATTTSFVNAISNGDLAGAVSAGASFANQVGDAFYEEEFINDTQLNAATSMAGTVSGLLTNPMETLKTRIPSFIQDINNLKKTQEDVKENTVPQNSKYENPTVYEEQQNKIDDLQRQNVSSYYAKALAMRVQIAKDKAETPEEIDTTNERELIQASVLITTKTAQRLARILEIEAAVYEYEMTQTSRGFIRMEETEDTQSEEETQAKEEEK